MKVIEFIWKLITLFTSVSIALATEQRSIWMPTCSTVSENTLISHPTDCRKFFICIQGFAYPISCPYGLNWNPTLNKCSTSLSSCENKQTYKIPIYNPLCPIDEDPANPTHLPDNNDCEKFYECQGGFAFHMMCPDQMHWSVEHENCVNASVANCKKSRKAIGNGQLNAECPLIDDPKNPIHLPHPEDCTKFLKCSFGRSYIVSCPFGLHWDVDVSRCESPFTAQCGTSKVTPGATTTATITASTIKKLPSQPSSTAKPSPNVPYQPSYTAKPSPNIPLQPSSTVKPNISKCPENGVKNFGIPGQCNKYFSCSQGKLYVVACRKGREWSEIVSGCVDSKLAGCTGLSNGLRITSTTSRSSYRPASSTSSYAQRPQVITSRPTSCTAGVGFLSHPTDCHKYLVCDNGKPIEMHCPDGLFFSHSTSSCQWTNINC